MKMIAHTILEDGSIINNDGNTVFFSFEKFEQEICRQGHCFVCGSNQKNLFNDEHVFPNWVIKKTGIHNKKLTLPNGNLVSYATYKIQCCEKCNSKLAEIYETPISQIFSKGYEAVIKYVQDGQHGRLCSWMSLIFLKAHLKNFTNKVSLDDRNRKGVIADEYDLHELHHIHAVARAATAGIGIDDKVFGSLIIIPLDVPENEKVFDYCDNLMGRTIMLRINDVALIYVLDDCGATIGMLSETLKELPDKLNDIQLREIYARYVAANIHIKSVPTFKTGLVGEDGKPFITVDLPNFEIHDYIPSVFGGVLANSLEIYKDILVINHKRGKEALNEIATGLVSFVKN
jgi:hypothetical protein